MFGNDAVYRSHRIVSQFKNFALVGLMPSEKYCLDLIPVSSRHSILDIGIGAGRTTGPLSVMFDKYVGVDKSENMITAAKSLYPMADLRTMDARKLDLGEKFDCVMFSFNGIDYVDYPTRQSILLQIANVIRPNGYLIYSTHNLHNKQVASWLKFLIVTDLVRPLRGLLRPGRLCAIAYRLVNFWRQSGDQSGSFAYVNDNGEGYTLLTTYVDVAGEITTIERHGFKVLATIGNTKQTSGYDEDDSWVYVVAKGNE
jgi:SAM-dependent methyltransferase